MEEYIKKANKKRAKKYVITVIILILLLIIGVLLYQVYLQIDINEDLQVNPSATVQKVSQTIESLQKESKTVSDMIENITSSVVGISKIKNTGNTIFLEDGSTKLGLGTGMIVSQDGYILTNEHVSGSKYSNCYVTLESGKSYSGNVVWSDSNIDLAIVKINVKNLPYVILGDSDQVRVGESVYAIRKPNWI